MVEYQNNDSLLNDATEWLDTNAERNLDCSY